MARARGVYYRRERFNSLLTPHGPKSKSAALKNYSPPQPPPAFLPARLPLQLHPPTDPACLPLTNTLTTRAAPAAMSSSMRNAVQRRNHKERAQPHERQKWGLLEKRKDYQLRARDFNAKKTQRARLSALARDRNPDEFYFKMISSRTRDGGVRVAERATTIAAQQLSHDAVKLLKTQDAGYVRLKGVMELRKIEELEQRALFLDDGEGTSATTTTTTRSKKHTVFVEDVQEAKNFDPAQYFDTHPDLVGRAFNRPRLGQLAEGGFGEAEVEEEAKSKGKGKGKGDDDDAKWRKNQEKKQRRKMGRAREQMYKELEARYKRRKELQKVDRELELQRARMGKGATAVNNKWAMVRKR